MALPVWPAALPPFDAAAYTRTPGPSGARFEPDRGPAKQRQLTRAAPWVLQLQLSLSTATAHRATFWTFWRDTLARGSLAFTMADPVEGGSYSWRFVVGAEPQERLEIPFWVLAFPLERLP